MRLSQRIHDICSCIDKGDIVADIGTDHGYVPMLLIKNEISVYAIMSDISNDSLQKAVETFKRSNIELPDSCFRVGDGLDTIKSAEVNTVIIAGLGAHTIIDILDKDIAKSKSYKKLVLQPRKYSGVLRHYLYTHGWDIISERLSPEGKFVCEIITAVPTDVSFRESDVPADDITWKYPKSFVYCDDNLLKKRLRWKFQSINEEIENLSKSINGQDKIDKLIKDREYLLELYRDSTVELG